MTSPVRLLLVDDDELQLELVERALSRDGFEVRGAGSITEITRVAKGFTPQLVLVDVNLGDTPTEQVIEVVRAVLPQARVVLYSAWEDSKLRKLATAIGVDGYISKSESVMALAAKLRSVAAS